jgi:hypothetical protein
VLPGTAGKPSPALVQQLKKAKEKADKELEAVCAEAFEEGRRCRLALEDGGHE